jgi:hypothetical protein
MSTQTLMKKSIHRTLALARPILTIGLGFFLALLSAALTYSTPPALEGTFGAAFLLQPTSTPPPKDLSEIGSTDGIVVMGFVIALIVVVPILWRRKAWMEHR